VTTSAESGLRSRIDVADMLAAAGVALLAVGALAGVVQIARTGWVPSSDQAFIEMAVRDVPSDLPLLGVFSRYGWSHPGPSWFYLLALPYRLAGSASEALAGTSLVLHVVAVAAAAWIARRLDRVAGVLVLVLLDVVLLAAGAAAVRDPWNPQVALVAAGLLVVCAWAAGERRPVAAGLLLPLATLLVQAHAANGPLVVAAVAAAALATWWPGSDRPPVPRGAWVAGAVVALALWVPPLVAQLRGDPGRISELFSAGTGAGPRAGLLGALGVFTGSFGLIPSWAGASAAREPYAQLGIALPVLFLVPMVGLVLAWRAGQWVLVRGVLVSSIATVAVGVGVAMVEVYPLDGTEIVFGYLLVALGSTSATTLAIGLAAALVAAPVAVRSTIRVVGGAVAVALGVTFVAVQSSTATPVPVLAPMVRTLGGAAVAATSPGASLVLLDAADYPGAEGVALALERAGVEVAVAEPELVTRFGPSRFAADSTGRTELIVTAVDRRGELQRNGWTVVAACGPGMDAAGEETIGGLVAFRGPDVSFVADSPGFADELPSCS